jgi:type VI secretion system protein ImpC
VIHGIVAPHLVPRADPRQEEMLLQLDEAVAEQMRLTLHDPAFQSLEASWRSVFLLLDRLDTGVDLKIDLIDVSKEELLADLGGSPESVEQTGLHRLLVDEAAALPGAGGYAVVACLHSFAPTIEELRALQAAAQIAERAGSPFIAGVSPELVGCARIDRGVETARWIFRVEDDEAEAAWRLLRALPESAWLALAMPRFLLRTPYGEEGSSTDMPGFEELPEHPSHAHFLWGSPAAACACLLGEAFMRNGWDLRPGGLGLLDRRPVWHAGEGADREMVPGAEVWLTDTAVERLLERGLTPLVSIKGRDAIAIARLQSVAHPPGPLRGPWSAA